MLVYGCTSHIMLSHQADPILHSMMKYLTRVRATIPHSLQDHLEHLEQASSSHIPLCKTLLQYGKDGYVLARVTQVVSSSHYYAHLLMTLDLQGSTVNLGWQADHFAMKLNFYFAKAENRIEVLYPSVGSLCAVKRGKTEDFVRAKVLAVGKVDLPSSTRVKLFLIDDGTIENRWVSELYSLPTKFTIVPPLAVSIHPCNISPLDKDCDWTPAADTLAGESLLQHLILGKMRLCISSEMWLHPLKICLSDSETKIEEHVRQMGIFSDLPQLLISQQLANESSSHLSTICDLASAAGIPMPPSGPEKEKQFATYEQAFLDPYMMYHEVYLTEVVSLNCFYVNRADLFKLVLNMEDDLQKEASKWRKEKLKKTIQIGQPCAVFTPQDGEEGRWYRGRVREMAEDICHVFMVDFGSPASCPLEDVVPLPSNFVTRLPAQAIECQLAHVEVKDGRDEDARDLLWSMAQEGDLQMKFTLKVLEKNIKSNTGMPSYVVEVFFEEAPEARSICKEFVNRGLVEYTDAGPGTPPLMETGLDSDTDNVLEARSTSEYEGDESSVCEEQSLENIHQNDTTDYTQSISMTDDLDLRMINSKEIDVDELFVTNFMEKFCGKKTDKKHVKALPAPEPNVCKLEKCGTVKELKKATDLKTETRNLVQPIPMRRVSRPPGIPPLGIIKNSPSDYCQSPRVTWGQDRCHLYMQFDLPVVDFHLIIKTQAIAFRAIYEDNFYEAELKLFGFIDPQGSKVEAHGRCIQLKTPKLRCGVRWPNLVKGPRKPGFLHPDPNLGDLSDSESDGLEDLPEISPEECQRLDATVKLPDFDQRAGDTLKLQNIGPDFSSDEDRPSEGASSDEDLRDEGHEGEFECALHLEENHKLVNFMVRWKDDTWYAKVHNKKRGSKLQVLALLGKKEKSLKPITILSDINDVPHALAFGAHDDFLAGISGKRLCLHSFKTQDKRFYFSGDFDLTCIACHPYQPVVATGNTLGRIIIWNDIWEQHYVRYYVHWHHLPVSDLAFSVDGTFLVSGGAENVLVRWRLEDETKEFIPRMGSPIVHITVAPDNAFIAIAHELNAVTLVSGNLTVVGKIQGLLQRVHWSEEQPCVKPMAVGLRSDPRSRSLVLNGIPGHLLFYSPELQKCLFHLDVTGVNQLNKQEGALIINSEVEHACFSDDGSHLATVERRDDGHNTPEIRLKFWLFRPHVGTYEMSTQIEYPHWKPMLALAFSGGNNPESCASISQDGFVKLWLHEIESVEGEEGEYWTYGPKASYCDCIPTCLSYSDDESLLAVGFGSVISLFHTPSLERLACLSESLELVQVEEEGPKKVEKLQNREVELMELDTEDKGEVIRSGRREEVNLKEEDDAVDTGIAVKVVESILITAEV
ncbi:unnamed protein product [Darwinula stevensoni]|uniref:Uncharacterized protein n=1 Tax=Darwinula stevensoni TaxID=69355 RepID=A0A7R9A4Z1_9CRUS|nr:unnamed protein product [Darwinula stevensoni]CAG0884394.1 unnamed protein product [Darwinula stevensoni]